MAFGQNARAAGLGFIAYLMGTALFWGSQLESSCLKKIFKNSFFWFLFVQMIQLSWMATTAYHGIFILLVYGVLCALMAIQFALVTLFLLSRKTISWMHGLIATSFWILLEYSRLFWFSGFTWNMTGLFFAHHTFPLQLASWIGVYGLSFWYMLMNIQALNALFLRKTKGSVASWLTLAFIPYLVGWGQVYYHDSKIKQSSKTNVVLVQTFLKPQEKIYSASQPESFISPYLQWHQLFQAIKKVKDQKIDLIIMPESTLPYNAFLPIYRIQEIEKIWDINFLHDKKKSLPKPTDNGVPIKVSNAFLAQALANYYQAKVIMGFDDHDDLFTKSYNAAFLFDPEKSMPKRYIKQILVPLAEYFPFEWSKKIAYQFGITGCFSAGPSSNAFGLNPPVGLSICYEETFSNIMRKTRLAGAELFVNISNDIWFPNSKLDKQHFEHARLRSVENGTPAVRSCNGGTTVALDALGRIVAQIKDNTKTDSLFVRLPRYHYHTFYEKVGDSFILIISGFFVVLFMLRSYFTAQIHRYLGSSGIK